MNILNVVEDVWGWIKADYKVWPLRFYLEVAAWVASIGCAIIMALTVPNTPFIMLYPVWVFSSAVFCWGAYTRKSFGMMGNYLLLVTIDSTALIRLILQIIHGV